MLWDWETMESSSWPAVSINSSWYSWPHTRSVLVNADNTHRHVSVGGLTVVSLDRQLELTSQWSDKLLDSSLYWCNSKSQDWLFGKSSCNLLLLARYIPNVAKRSIWDQWKYVYTDDWPATNRQPTSHLENFKRRYLSDGSSDPLHVWF